MTFLYHISIHIYYFLVLIASVFNPKASLWIKGRMGWRVKIRNWNPEGKKVIWFHAASLGEFEQGRPLIDKIRENHPDCRILLTFYSPSGFEIRKNYPGADLVMYLPLDTSYNARLFVSVVNPIATIFIKYEFWHFYLKELHQSNHLVYLISAIFRPDQAFFKWYGAWFRKNLLFIDFFFVQDKDSAHLLRQAALTNCKISGDTRFDRVKALADGAKDIEIARLFSSGHMCLVAGSTWPEDEELLTRFINESDPSLRFIIAPHEITATHIHQLTSRLTRAFVLYSQASTRAGFNEKQVLIIDNIGMLSSLYRYGRIAYIGGGFGKGIHNILEAAAFGIPVIFGPNFGKFREARELLGLGGAFNIQSYEDLHKILYELGNNPEKYKSSALTAGTYVRENTGATSIIFDFLAPVF
jgi:3-deoxy-D-manno-octulosonic-acid transferase